ncbi:putative zinc finger protein [Schistosoma mansoni]|uniref:putative zinc finger protein n=1 Tax=Schistosoma mansoni TaxID=6183 RepID=UPI00019B34A6|nr:putative zinc finger protein [Schistosoma mansoni]|eukprot:XP_018652163.1 putative zinc finger protein [Schistosoma mansoni]
MERNNTENIPKAIDDTNQAINCYIPNRKQLDDLQKELEKYTRVTQNETYKDFYFNDDNFRNTVLKHLSFEQSSYVVDRNTMIELKNQNNLENSEICYSIMNGYPLSSFKLNFSELSYSQKYDNENCIIPSKGRHYKTELCKRYLNSSNGDCSYGNKCQFAHGINELRFAPRHPRYKTEICYSYHVFGTCNYGKRCDFIHDEPLEKLILIRLQNQLFQAYRKSHPHVQEVRLIELLGLQEDNLESLKILSSALYDEKTFHSNDDNFSVITNSEL